MQALLWLNGDVSGHELSRLKGHYNMVLAVDGGLKHALHHGYTPQAVLGDFDSAKNLTHGPWQKLHRPNPQFTDLAKALDYCREWGVTEVDLVGALGGRFDHCWANLSLLLGYRRFFQQNIYGAWEQLFWLSSQLTLNLQVGQRVSLLALSAAYGVSSVGLQYPLRNTTLTLGGFQGVSNQASGETVQLTLKQGLVLVCVGYEEIT